MFLRVVILLVCSFWSTVSCFAQGQDRKLVLMFTSDLHSALLPDNDGNGGLARIAAIVQQQRSDAEREGAAFLLVDGGDIAMGSIFHTAFDKEAIEYRGLARMGYDAVAFGNHDFDFGTDALVSMYSIAHKQDSCLKWPVVLSANLQVQGIGAEKYRIFECNGLKVGVFGVMGENSFTMIARNLEKLHYSDAVAGAMEAVSALKSRGVDYIVALSHGGILDGDDIKLAKKVDGIDFIVSAHDHCLLEEPVVVRGTYIGAAGTGGKHVGKAVFEGGKLLSYEMLPVDGNVQPECAFDSWVGSMYNVVGTKFEQLSGRKLDDTVAFLDARYLKMVDENDRMPLGSNVAESYREAAIALLSDVPAEDIVGVVPFGVLRDGLDSGAVTVRDAFEVLSLGENSRGYFGYPLVYGYLSGKEIKDLCELSVSVASSAEDMKLFFSGLQYRYNGARLPFLKVDRVMVGGKPVEPEKLYVVVTGKYTAGLIGLLEKESYGILSANIKDAKGDILEDGKLLPLLTVEGKEIPEWEAFVQYLQQGKFNPVAGDDVVENDDFVPLGYTLAAILLCAFILYCMRDRRGLPRIR